MKRKIFIVFLLITLTFFIDVAAQNRDVFQKKFIKSQMLKIAGWQLKNPNHAPNDWTNGAFYENLYKEMAAKIITLQQADGLWRSSLLDLNSYPGGEASGSGFYIYALSWGINNKMLDKNKYLPAVKKAWIGLNTLVREDGKVGWTQPIGADPRKNFDAESWEVYGAGAFLLAGSEVIKFKL